MIELGNDEDIVEVFVHRPGVQRLVAASDGRGFLVAAEGTPAQTRAGRQVLNVRPPAEACLCVPANGDAVAVVGENRRLLIFPLDEIPTLARGRGVILQRHRDGGLSDATVFTLADGLTWRASGRPPGANPISICGAAGGAKQGASCRAGFRAQTDSGSADFAGSQPRSVHISSGWKRALYAIFGLPAIQYPR